MGEKQTSGHSALMRAGFMGEKQTSGHSALMRAGFMGEKQSGLAAGLGVCRVGNRCF